MLASPSDLFSRVLRRKQSKIVNSEAKCEETVAQVLCQAFDYIIRSGLLYVDVSSQHSLILLKIEELAAWKLSFH